MSDENSKPSGQQTINVVIVSEPKNVVVALLLALFFGPLGMLYSTVIGAIIMLIVSLVLGFITLGFGLLITQPICVIWSVIAASNHNKKHTTQAQRH